MNRTMVAAVMIGRKSKDSSNMAVTHRRHMRRVLTVKMIRDMAPVMKIIGGDKKLKRYIILESLAS